MYSSDSYSFALFLRNLVWEYFIIICLFSDLFISSDKARGPVYDLGPLPLQKPLEIFFSCSIGGKEDLDVIVAPSRPFFYHS